MKRLWKKWMSLPEFKRDIVKAVIILDLSLVAAAFLFAFCLFMKEASVLDRERGELVSLSLAGTASRALDENRSSIFDFRETERYGFIETVGVYKNDGSLFASNGRDIAQNKRFQKSFAQAVKNGETVLAKSGSYLEIFKPLPDGLLYLNISRSDHPLFVWGMALLLTFTGISLAPAILIFRKCGKISSLAEVEKERAIEKMAGLFTSEWTKLLHAIKIPVMTLDKEFRLVDLNGPAAERFDITGELAEGRHVIDIVGSSSEKDDISQAIAGLCGGEGGTIRRVSGITIFSNNIEPSNFRYAVMME